MAWIELLERLSCGEGDVVVPAPGLAEGNWAGAATAVCHEGVVWLAYRTRRPEGRGVSTTVARSDDGVVFEPVVEIQRESFGAESFERPALIPLPSGGWRLYLSCATPDSKHWWIDTLTADTPESLATGERCPIELDVPDVALKDPVIQCRGEGEWDLWVCCHPLDVPGEEDRMYSVHATSGDGLSWAHPVRVLSSHAGRWDARGARVTTVLDVEPLAVLYDGRPDAESNWHETSGLALAQGDVLVAAEGPFSSPWSDGALRYASAVTGPGGRKRLYAERARPDGAHDLVTVAD